MTTKEKILQLKPATNWVELMQLLNTIHRQALLLDPYFMADENLLRLLGQGRIEFRKDPNEILDFKSFSASDGNFLGFQILITGRPTSPIYSSLTIGNYKPTLPFGYELIEAYLIAGAEGDTPHGPLKPMTNEARNYAGGRPLATHPKGYGTYIQDIRTANHYALVDVVLDRNAQVLNIELIQRED